MTVDTLQILSLADRLVVTPVDGGFGVYACCGSDCVFLHENGVLLVYETSVDAAMAFKDALKPDVPILLDVGFDFDLG